MAIVRSLQRLSTFAPSFTSLGVYYSHTGDTVRASKSFQKAFELDPRETEAARRLAEGLANEREWDLVNVIARRVIDGEGGTEIDGNISQEEMARYSSANGWAWKAVGVVELVGLTSHPQSLLHSLTQSLSEPSCVSICYHCLPDRAPC